MWNVNCTIYHSDIFNLNLERVMQMLLKFEVMLMNTEDSKKLHILEESLNKEDLKITKHVWLIIMDDFRTSVKARESHNILQPWISHCTTKKVKGKMNLWMLVTIPGLLFIKPAKKEDLISMISYFPEEFRQFYYIITPA